jgi:hypothetical protein
MMKMMMMIIMAHGCNLGLCRDQWKKGRQRKEYLWEKRIEVLSLFLSLYIYTHMKTI